MGISQSWRKELALVGHLEGHTVRVSPSILQHFGLWEKTVFFLSRYNPNRFLHRILPNLKTPAITFVNAHTISHYLQTSVLSWNQTLSIKCCSETYVNLVFMSQCYFASIFYSIADIMYITKFIFFFTFHSMLHVCLSYLLKYWLTYLLIYFASVLAYLLGKRDISILHLVYMLTQGPTQPFIPPGVGKWVAASAGKAKAGMVHSVSGWTRGVQVKLWDPLRTRAVPEHLRDVFTTRRYTNPRLPYLTYLTGFFGIRWPLSGTTNTDKKSSKGKITRERLTEKQTDRQRDSFSGITAVQAGLKKQFSKRHNADWQTTRSRDCH